MWRWIVTLFFIGISHTLWAKDKASAYVQNLTLLGVIHVEGSRQGDSSLAVVRDRYLGKTRMLRVGERFGPAELVVHRLQSRQMELVSGTQTFTLRVEGTGAEEERLEIEASEVAIIRESEELERIIVPRTDKKEESEPLSSSTPLEESKPEVMSITTQRYEPPKINLAPCEGEACGEDAESASPSLEISGSL